MRVTHAYDEASRDMIAGEYARSTHAFHGCSPEILKSGLLGTIDLLWAAVVPSLAEPAPEKNILEDLLWAASSQT